MATRIILVRHGESLGNKNRIFLGHTDWDLTELGYTQAELTAEYLDRYEIDAVYSSDLIRAYHTVEPTADRRGLKIHKSERLREINAGDWEALKYNEITERYGDEYYVWRNDIGHARCTSGESVAELQKRVLEEYRRIARLNSGKTVLIGTHATPIRALKCHFLGMDLEQAKDIEWAPNASITVTDAENEKIILDGYAEHLGENFTKLKGKV